MNEEKTVNITVRELTGKTRTMDLIVSHISAMSIAEKAEDYDVDTDKYHGFAIVDGSEFTIVKGFMDLRNAWNQYLKTKNLNLQN